MFLICLIEAPNVPITVAVPEKHNYMSMARITACRDSPVQVSVDKKDLFLLQFHNIKRKKKSMFFLPS